MLTILQKLELAASNHARDTFEPDNEVEDLSRLLYACWAQMTLGQKETVLRSDTVEHLVEMGSHGQFDHLGLVHQLLDEEQLPVLM